MAAPVLPWIIALGGTALVALSSKKAKAKAEPIEVEPTPTGPKPPKFTTMPVQPKPVPRTKLPPIIPPDAEEVPDPGFTDVSPGQPIQPPKKTKPKGIKLPAPVTDVIEDVVAELPIDPGVIEQPITIDEPIDLGELEEIVLDVDEILDPTDLAVEVYNITQGGVRNLKGSEVQTIRAYQTEQGLKPDGLYGPNTAESLIPFGFVPETPWIWPRNNTSQAKRDWKELTADMAEQDPQRAEEWHESGNI